MSEILIDDNIQHTVTRAEASVWPTAIKYGALGAIINGALTLLWYNLGLMEIGPDGQTSSYVPSVMSSVIFILVAVQGVRAYKATNGDTLSFSRGLLYSLAFGVIGGLVGALLNYIIFAFLMPEYLETMRTVQMAIMEDQGMSESELATSSTVMDTMLSPAVMAGSSVIFSVVMSIIVGGITTLVIKNK